ncbi:GNAT family N-acetyltransferase [Paeniglutamicibacter sp. R2-26]|uniref:GNAT family N-acetyltransferase n=1 Tax=Paeniglutamicibacter sp. R2-26 TaxID=3144417 RepID=UPI003EE81486
MSRQIVRLGGTDTKRATTLFALMAEVFEEPAPALDRDYVSALLADSSFWAYAVIVDGEVCGGITAHVLPMTRSMDNELMIYDLAVGVEHQRTGLGRQLMQAVIDDAASAGIATVFVPAEAADDHAVEFYKAQGGVRMDCVIFSFETTGTAAPVVEPTLRE